MISNKDTTEFGVLTFTLSDINVSLANALRRVIITNIPTVVFETEPYEANKAVIYTNTSRFNNEIIKQRLSCIPIHIKDVNSPLDKYIMELNVENNTDVVMYVTTEQFKIKNKETDEYLSDAKTKEIFPPNIETNYYIDFLRLRPRISNDLPGEKIHLTCTFSVKSVKDNSMYNTTSICTYGFSIDLEKRNEILQQKKQEWKDEQMTKEEIEYETKNWLLLDGLRITKKNSFDFKIQTVGVYENEELVKKGCEIIIQKLVRLKEGIETEDENIVEIKKSINTLENSFDICLKNENETIGKVMEWMVYDKYFEQEKTVSYCGFKVFHPHDLDSILRISYFQKIDKILLKENLISCINDAILIYDKIPF